MSPERYVFILGAGASRAYARNPYPLLPDLLPEMIEAEELETGKGGRPKLYRGEMERERDELADRVKLAAFKTTVKRERAGLARRW